MINTKKHPCDACKTRVSNRPIQLWWPLVATRSCEDHCFLLAHEEERQLCDATVSVAL